MKVTKAADHKYLDEIVTCQMEMAKETEGLELVKETLTEGVKAVLDDPNKGEYFLILQDEKLMGMCLTLPEWSDWRNAQVLWIHSVYIFPTFRKQGLYKKLYTYLQEMVKNNPDIAGLRLYVDKTNTSAQAVYTKLGMNNEHYELFEWMIK